MVTDVLNSKEVAELIANSSKLASSEKSVITEPKKRGGRPKKESADKA